ncbi:MAG TPA: SDR family oxidoreductase [Candidatus Acidoferrales bacterium]
MSAPSAALPQRPRANRAIPGNDPLTTENVPIFLTGSTGYIGAHVAANLLAAQGQTLNVLVRARDSQEARGRLWHGFQLHMDLPQFEEFMGSRVRIFLGDLTAPHFGLADDDYLKLVRSTDSVIHCAASLNRKSEKSCLNVNLRGTLEVIQLAARARDDHGLRRFSHVSTVAVAGHRANETVQEDEAIDWNRSDYDPYARTKKFCEHMIRQLLADVPRTIFRPSIVLGDSRRPETNQFDMVRAFVFLAGLPALPFRATDKVDIVPVDYVAGAISTLHQRDNPMHEIYHLSSGTASETFQELTDALAKAQGKRGPVYVPSLEKSSTKVVNALAGRAGKIGGLATLMKVFLPYLVWNTVFDNRRVAAEMGERPAPFSRYCYDLLRFSRENKFQYPYRDLPAPTGHDRGLAAAQSPTAARGSLP